MKCIHKGAAKPRVKVRCSKDSKEGLKFSLVNECNIHFRCLPKFAPEGKMLEEWNKKYESKLYKLCHNCNDRRPA
jgi:hypothetical protein